MIRIQHALMLVFLHVASGELNLAVTGTDGEATGKFSAKRKPIQTAELSARREPTQTEELSARRKRLTCAAQNMARPQTDNAIPSGHRLQHHLGEQACL